MVDRVSACVLSIQNLQVTANNDERVEFEFVLFSDTWSQ